MTATSELTALCALVRWSYRAASVSIAVVEDDGLSYVAADGVASDRIVGTRLAGGEGIAGFVAATGQSITVKDPTSDPRHAHEVSARVGFVPSSIQCVPFQDRSGETIGVLSILDRGVDDSGSQPAG